MGSAFELQPHRRGSTVKQWLRIIVLGFGAGYWTSSVLWTLHHPPTGTPMVHGGDHTCDDLLSDTTLVSTGSSSLPSRRQFVADSTNALLRGSNATRTTATAVATTRTQEKNGRKHAPSPDWWKRHLPILLRTWNPRSPSSWCTLEEDPPTPMLLDRHERAEGMVYIKTYKASSSTCEGIAWHISYHVARRLRLGGDGSTTTGSVCKAYTRHEFADNRMHARLGNHTLLWTFVRAPAARDLSHINHFEIGRKERHMTSLQIQKQIESRIKGRQTRYLVPIKPTKAPLWPRHELRKNASEVVEYLKKHIMETYDFLGVTERMTESLAVMVLLWDLQPQDVIVLHSKRSGGWDDGFNQTCKVIPKAQLTPELEEYFATRHQIWNADVLLYQATVACLDQTIETLGRERVMNMANRIEALQQQAQTECLTEANFPCSINGTFQPELSDVSCYIQDAGCGHECVDRVLSSRH